MRILQVGKFHFPQGGADKYFLDLSRELEERGHTVARFSMRHPKNEPTKWEQYFISQVDFNHPNLWNVLRGLRAYYSFETRRKFECLVRDFRPDIIHAHSTCHHLSPSFLSVAKKYGIPVVMHLHDYKLVSPNYLLYTEKGNYEGGKEEKYFECFRDRCFKNSYLKSFLVALEMYFHHRVLKIFTRNVAVFVAPSQCLKEVVNAWRSDIQNIRVIPHGLALRPLTPATVSGEEPYYLAVGRLSFEKGFDILLQAFARLQEPSLQLKIAGTGPEEAKLKELARTLGIGERVDFLGFQSGQTLESLVEGSLAVVVPSLWREVFGLVAIEAMERGKPVIASRIGALPEIIEEKRTGRLFESGNAEDLADVLQWIFLRPEEARRMGQEARARVEQRYTLEGHMRQVENLYRELTAAKTL